MPYDAALSKGWDEVEKLPEDRRSEKIRLLDDTYHVSVADRRITADS